MKHSKTTVILPTPVVESGLRFTKTPEARKSLLASFAWAWCHITKSDIPRDMRRQAGIQCFNGLNGSGKTLRMVEDIEPELSGLEWECYEEDHFHNDPQYGSDGDFIEFGPQAVHKGFVRVLSTVRLLDPITGKLHARYERFDDWQLLEKLEHAVVLLDEIQGVAHSRDSGGLPPNIMNLLMQLRKGEVRVLWSAPHWARADKLIREVTVTVTICEGSYPARGSGSLWLPNRRFLYRTYSTEDFDEWSSGKATKLRPLVTQRVWGPGSIGFRLYNTKQKVTSIGHANEAGACVACGGLRRRQECNCGDYLAHKADRRPAPRRGAVVALEAASV